MIARTLIRGCRGASRVRSKDRLSALGRNAINRIAGPHNGQAGGNTLIKLRNKVITVACPNKF